ncbi:MAG: DUF4194 domain-containing protein [Verrucomicrobiota bacterium]
MTLPWPTFWEAIREEDRPALKTILAELLTTGVLLGDEGRARELYLIAREYPRELAEFLAVLDLELIHDPDRPIFQARPVAGECALTASFTKDETLLVLALWRIYDEERMARPAQSVVLDANMLDARLRLYFEAIEPPQPTQLDRILAKLRRKKLIRYQRDEEQFGASQIEILPTLPRVIPFEDAAAWEEQTALFNQSAPGVESADESTPEETLS